MILTYLFFIVLVLLNMYYKSQTFPSKSTRKQESNILYEALSTVYSYNKSSRSFQKRFGKLYWWCSLSPVHLTTARQIILEGSRRNRGYIVAACSTNLTIWINPKTFLDSFVNFFKTRYFIHCSLNVIKYKFSEKKYRTI